MTVKFVKPKKPAVPPIGVFSPYGPIADYYAGRTEGHYPHYWLPLGFWDKNTWKALKEVGIEIPNIKLTYDCPWTDNKYFGCLPVGILTENIDQYFKEDYWFKKLASDRDYYSNIRDPSEDELNLIGINEVERVLMGHSYHDGILPNDGYAQIVYVFIDLDNGDKLICLAWEWFNK